MICHINPRHSLSIALKKLLTRAKITKANVVLVLATPAIESYYVASKGVYKLIELTKRANDSGASQGYSNRYA